MEKLSSGGKRIDAIRFVYAFGLVEKFPPVLLLKAYLEYARKVSKRLANKGKNTVGAKVSLLLCACCACCLVNKKLPSKYEPVTRLYALTSSMSYCRIMQPQKK